MDGLHTSGRRCVKRVERFFYADPLAFDVYLHTPIARTQLLGRPRGKGEIVKSFEYRAATSVREAVSMLNETGRKVRALAGGTDLLPRMRSGLVDADVLVDVKPIDQLNGLVSDRDGLTIGAAVPLYRIYEDKGIAAAYPALVDAIANLGGVATQGRASLGGNLCNAAPSGDSIPALIVLGATCSVAGVRGRRRLPVAEFCTAPGQTDLKRGELLVSIHVPPPTMHMGSRYLRFTSRNEMDIAVVGVGASLVLNKNHSKIRSGKIALGAVAPTPLFVKRASEVLVGRTPSEELWAEAAVLAQDAANPISDVRGSARQRKHLVGVLTKRALHGAHARALGENAL